MNDSFKVIFSGEVAEGYLRKDVQVNLQKAMRASPEQIKRLFSGKSIQIKKNLSKQAAESFVRKLADLGVVAKIAVEVTSTSSSKTGSAPPAKAKSSGIDRLSLVAKEPDNTPKSIPDQEEMPSDAAILREKMRNLNVRQYAPRTSFQYIAPRLKDFLCVFLGVALVLTFSPYPDGTIKRGALLGFVLISVGVFFFLRRGRD
ncbi:hypothetical protein [Teredinibacter sp. KSP-S5-2]|uniref:hypothetical protein n=1 Tax=Teredinibacter sp. KSP-S5-2 TaxID=3034506 RepID=UPI0029345F5F|nr:hypothetical protein [Teredinibacter sp. KSP-S5-2]WNO11308.1 hypothetical protein P5V12_09000 [Teredinibacter sp. KSP-S5-2]